MYPELRPGLITFNLFSGVGFPVFWVVNIHKKTSQIPALKARHNTVPDGTQIGIVRSAVVTAQISLWDIAKQSRKKSRALSYKPTFTGQFHSSIKLSQNPSIQITMLIQILPRGSLASPPHPELQTGLFIPKAFDRIELGCFIGRINAKYHADNHHSNDTA